MHVSTTLLIIAASAVGVLAVPAPQWIPTPGNCVIEDDMRCSPGSLRALQQCLPKLDVNGVTGLWWTTVGHCSVGSTCVSDGLGGGEPRCVPWVMPCHPYCKAAELAAAANSPEAIKPEIDPKFKKVNNEDAVSTVAAGGWRVKRGRLMA